jgi:hypothetical protein
MMPGTAAESGEPSWQPATEGLAHDRLALGVDGRGVEHVDAGVDGRGNRGAGLVPIRRPPEHADAAAAEGERAGVAEGSEGVLAHGRHSAGKEGQT